MNFRCWYCHNEFSWEEGSYSYIRTKILLHLEACDATRELDAHARATDASWAADRLFHYPAEPSPPLR